MPTKITLTVETTGTDPSDNEEWGNVVQTCVVLPNKQLSPHNDSMVLSLRTVVNYLDGAYR